MPSRDSQQRLQQLIRILADGEFHSGQSLAETLGISRTAVWKLIQKLQSWQIEIWSVRGKGYQVPGGFQLLNEEQLASTLRQQQSLIQWVKVFPSIDSTANYMAAWWRDRPGPARVCIAEHQSAGRGRKGRPWVSPFAGNFYFSVGMQMPLGLNALGGLSIAIGLGLAETIDGQLEAPQVKVKWPNDLLVENRKLAGILIEASGDSNDTSFLNIGIGVNWKMDDREAQAIDQPWTALTDLHLKATDRQAMMERLLMSVSQTLSRYAECGFADYQSMWPRYSAWFGKTVRLHSPQRVIEGVEVGINEQGALLLDTENGIQTWFSGEVSLRR